MTLTPRVPSALADRLRSTLRSPSSLLAPPFLLALVLLGTGCGGGGGVELPCGPPFCELTAMDGADNDFFGDAVSLSGDAIIVGAPGDSDGGLDSGSAYVFRFNGFEWYEEDKLLASDAAASDFFGYSVSIDGDVAVIGAIGDDDEGETTGAAYVFRYDGMGWVEEQKLVASDGAESDTFGFVVSISGDAIAVSAHADDDTFAGSGSVYVYRYDGMDWVEETKLHASDPANKAFFGFSVSIDGDSIVVGATGDAEGGDRAGAAYVFEYDGMDWSEDQKLTASDAEELDYFGTSVAIAGDAIVVGATGEDLDDDNKRSGAAYAFGYDGSDWVEETKLVASDGAGRDFFGTAVAVDGDTIVVGAQAGNDDEGVQSGSAYVFGFDGTDWLEEEELLPPNAGAGELFGSALAVEGDRIVCGAPSRDSVGSSSGSAFVYE